MMRLQNLRVNNFRPFSPKQEFTLDLGHSVVLFYGGNGSGKSSVFDAIEMSLSGSIKRLANYGPQARLVVNARYPNQAVGVTLDLLRDSTASRAKIEIPPNSTNPKTSGVLSASEIDLFYCTSYLMQSDIRRLVSADSSGLGEVVARLVVDEDVDLLFRGLADANISRNDASFQRVRFAVEELEEEVAQLAGRIENQKKTISTIQEKRIDVQEVAARVADLSKALAKELPRNKLASLQQLLAFSRELDDTLQTDLRKVIAERDSTERTLSTCTSLKVQQSRLDPVRLRLKQLQGSLQLDKKRLAEARNQSRKTAAELQKRNAEAGSNERLSGLIQVLSQIDELSEPGMCPVCDRSFPNLKAHIRQKLARLEREQTSFQKSMSEIQTQRRRLLDAENKLRASMQEKEQEIETLSGELDGTQKRILTFVSRYELESGESMNLQQIEAFEKKTLEDLSKRHAKLEEYTQAISQIRSEILAATTGLSQEEEGLGVLEKRKAELQTALQAKRAAFDRLEAFIDTTQEARRKISDLIETLLKEFVQGRARSAFEDLFRRITRHPYFRVTIPTSEVRYHKPEVTWVATYGQRVYPGAAVFSQGQLNACALALFLALATTQTSHLGLLLLDDPVQSMDEIHVEEFASILKSIKDVLRWQVIIGVHEESLFNYLKRILYPCETDQSLAAYTLIATEDGPQIENKELFRYESKAFSLLPSHTAA